MNCNQELAEEKLDELKEMKDLKSYNEVQNVAAKIKHRRVEGGVPNFLSVFKSHFFVNLGLRKEETIIRYYDYKYLHNAVTGHGKIV